MDLSRRATNDRAIPDQRLTDVERELRSVPSRWLGREVREPQARIGGGNDISPSGYRGVKKIDDELATLAGTYDLSTIPALDTEEGLGWAWHYDLGRWVLVLHDSRSACAHDLPKNTPVWLSSSPITISAQSCYVITAV